MRNVSDRFDPSVSHQVSTLAQVLDSSGEILQDEFTFDSASVTLDPRGDIRGRAEVSVAGEEWVPSDPADLLAPYGNQVRLWRGIEYAVDDVELLSLGKFRIEEVSSDNGVTSMTCLDQSQIVAEAIFDGDYTISAGTDYLTAILTIVQDVLPDVEYDFPDRTLVTPTLIAEEGDNRWDFVLAMAESIGMEIYFDGDGVLVMRPVPDTGDTPVADLVEGEGSVLLQASKRWSRSETFNRWVYIGDNPDNVGAPPRGVAVDDDPNSPTYFYGSFGQKSAPPEQSSFITTDAQAEDAAQGRLSKERGTAMSIDFGIVVNPALEPGDVVRIQRESSGLPDQLHIIDSLVIPLSASESMSGTTRTARVI